MPIRSIHRSLEVSRILREIADGYDEGEFGKSSCTVIIGEAIYSLGSVHDDQAVKNTVWDCNYAIQSLTSRLCRGGS